MGNGNGYLRVTKTNSDFQLNGNTESARNCRRHLDSITETLVQMRTDNLFDTDSSGRSQSSREADMLKEQIEEVQAEIAAYIQRAQAELDREIERARNKAKNEYNPDTDGDDEEAFIQSEISKIGSLNRTIEVPPHLQTKLESLQSLLKIATGKETAQAESQDLVSNMIAVALEEVPEIASIDFEA